MYDNLEDLISSVTTRNEWIMNARYKTRLDECVRNLNKLNAKLVKMNYEIDNNPQVFSLTDEMESYVNQTKTLTRIAAGLEE
jgi:hypothetical protein